ncbi:hypothetical protein BDK51DRAFT_40387, partial [Blyttiomyces helicus]
MPISSQAHMAHLPASTTTSKRNTTPHQPHTHPRTRSRSPPTRRQSPSRRAPSPTHRAGPAGDSPKPKKSRRSIARDLLVQAAERIGETLRGLEGNGAERVADHGEPALTAPEKPRVAEDSAPRGGGDGGGVGGVGVRDHINASAVFSAGWGTNPTKAAASSALRPTSAPPPKTQPLPPPHHHPSARPPTPTLASTTLWQHDLSRQDPCDPDSDEGTTSSAHRSAHRPAHHHHLTTSDLARRVARLEKSSARRPNSAAAPAPAPPPPPAPAPAPPADTSPDARFLQHRLAALEASESALKHRLALAESAAVTSSARPHDLDLRAHRALRERTSLVEQTDLLRRENRRLLDAEGSLKRRLADAEREVDRLRGGGGAAD